MTPATADVARRLPLAAAPVAQGGGRRVLLIVTCLLVAASTIRALRIELGGLLIPLHVLPVLLAMPSIVIPSFARIPASVRTTLLIFLGLFAFSVLRYGESFGDMVKMAASVATIFAVALMVKSRDDFVKGTIALSISILIANINGLRGGYVYQVGYRAADVGNKNSYSLYALPVILFVGFMVIHFRTSLKVRALALITVVSTAFVLFTGANRSGWGGMLVIGAMLAIQTRRWRALFLVGVMAALSYAALTLFGTTETFDRRLQQTREGNSSDDARMDLLATSLEIAVENPIFGVTPQELGAELARRLQIDAPVIDTHNFVAYIAGGSGFPALFALLAVALALCRRPMRATATTIAASDLLRMLCLLFLLRGQFSREIFFVGPFPITLGLGIGLLLVTRDERSAAASLRQSPA